MNETKETSVPSPSPSPRTIALRTSRRRASGKPAVVFVAMSALGVAAMPGLTQQLMGSLASTVVSDAYAGEKDQGEDQGDDEQTISQGYEEQILTLLWELGVDVPEEVAEYISLLELSEEYGGGTVIREGDVAVILTEEGQTIPAPAGFYVFPDGIVAFVKGEGTIGAQWGAEACDCDGGYWAMCRTKGGGWVDCT